MTFFSHPASYRARCHNSRIGPFPADVIKLWRDVDFQLSRPAVFEMLQVLTMSQAIPPPMPSPAPKREQTVRIAILILLACLIVLIIFPLFIRAIRLLSEVGPVKFSTGKFQVTVLEMKSEPNYLTGRVRIKCEGDMEAGIWVTDLKRAGFSRITGTNGLVFYRERNPYKIGGSVPVHADGQFSTCDILFKVSITSSNTIWHDEEIWHNEKSRLDTALPTALLISEVQTNWPENYERGSALPLANLGGYKILVSAK